jgi:hypothetical protein
MTKMTRMYVHGNNERQMLLYKGPEGGTCINRVKGTVE